MNMEDFESIAYTDELYEEVVAFLIELNQDGKRHINWNWARFEWMMSHPWFDASAKQAIRVWKKEGKVVALAIYDMSFGEAFVGALPGFGNLLDEALAYAFKELKDEDGLGIAVDDQDEETVSKLTSLGYMKVEQSETMMSLSLESELPVDLPSGFSIVELDPKDDPMGFQWLIWRGFDHGDNREEFEKDGVLPENYVPNRPHFNPFLSLAVLDEKGEKVAYCCLWFDPRTDYAYIEPVCAIPAYRRRGLTRSLLYEAMNRARGLGAKKAYVISDMPFYSKLGFSVERHYSFYRKKDHVLIHGRRYSILRLLGKGKGGYSFLAEIDGRKVVLKQIHHEPCSYYSFGDKIEAERNDYLRLEDAGIRIPRMLDIDSEREIVIKEFVDGDVISDLLEKGRSVEEYIPQVEEMAEKAKAAGLNIDYYPTNFVVRDGLLYYIDYECNLYMDEWSLANWGIKYWRN